jgi:chlorobactene lauroyltransferase
MPASDNLIPAHKNPFGEAIFWQIARASMQRHFNSVQLRDRGRLAEDTGSLPILMLANHSSWWDGYFAWLIAHSVERQDHYLMMEEANLRRYRFFTWAGCFSVDRMHGRAALASIHYAAHLLKERPGRAVWIFPQGEIVPNDRRPLRCYSGIGHLVRQVGAARCYPVALRIEYGGEQRPDVFISIGPGRELRMAGNGAHVPGDERLWQAAHEHGGRDGQLCGSTARDLAAILATDLTAELDRLRDDVLAGSTADFTVLLHGRRSMNRLYDAMMLRQQT